MAVHGKIKCLEWNRVNIFKNSWMSAVPSLENILDIYRRTSLIENTIIQMINRTVCFTWTLWKHARMALKSNLII